MNDSARLEMNILRIESQPPRFWKAPTWTHIETSITAQSPAVTQLSSRGIVENFRLGSQPPLALDANVR